MNDCIVNISLDDAFDCYEMSKRQISDTPLYYYDPVKNEFSRIKSPRKNSEIFFINSYALCSRLIDEYLDQPQMSAHKQAFKSKSKSSRNKIVDFLWYFEHIDGCCGFKSFEISRVTKELITWCKNNGLKFSEPEVYRVN